MDKNTVLSFCSDSEALKLREDALHNGGMAVVSVMSEAEARLEITMGRCGVLLICYRLSETETQHIAKLFRNYCSQGRIIFVEGPSNHRGHAPTGTDFVLPESDGPVQIAKDCALAFETTHTFAPAL